MKDVLPFAKWGALAGAAYFVADLVGALVAVGSLFDPTLDGLALLGVGLAVAVVVGAGLGAALGCGVYFWRSKRGDTGPIYRPSPKAMVLIAALLVAAIAVGGYQLRRERTHLNAITVTGSTPRPPVLFILIDTLRADSFYGNALDFPHSPKLKKWAEKAVVFSDAESAAGWTLPSLATILTGLHNTAIDASAGRIPPGVTTFPKLLNEAGYQAHAYVDNALVEPRRGYAAGFSSFFQRSAFRFAFSLPTFRLLPDTWREWLRYNLRTSDYGAERLTNSAIGDIENAPPDSNYFLYVHYMDPHAPYYAHEGQPEPPADSTAVFLEPVGWRLRKGEGPPPTPAELKWLRHYYDQEIAYTDQHVWRLLEAWRARFGEQGLVVITSDHGEEFLDHGQLQHSLTVQREMVHVPLLMQFPEAEGVGNKVVTEPVSHLDLAPTLLSAVGLLPPASMPGVSWLPWLKEKEKEQGQMPAPLRPLVASHSRHGRSSHRYREGSLVFLKTMFYDGRPTQTRVFDLASDPTEQHDIYKQHALAPELETRFETRIAELSKAKGVQAAPELDDEALRALGYVQ